MPAIGQSHAGAVSANRQRRRPRRRPAAAPRVVSAPRNADTGDPARSRPVYHPPARTTRSAPRNADTGDPARSRPATRPVGPTGRAPIFQPPQSQRAPFRTQQDQARARTQRNSGRLGDRRYDSRPPAAPPERPPFRIDPTQIGRAPAFRLLTSQLGPFRIQQSRARHAVRDARNRLPDHPAIPEVVNGLYLKSDLDKLDREYRKARLKAARGHLGEARSDYERARRKLADTPTEELLQRVRDAYKKAARELGGRSVNDLYQYASLRQRRQIKRVARFAHAYEGYRAQQVAAYRGIGVNQDVAKPKVQTALGKPVKAGFFGDVSKALDTVGGALDRATRIPNHRDASVADLFNIGPQIALATLEDPGAVARSSVRTGIESIAGIPQGIKQLVTDPKGAGAATIADYERRYGSIFDNPAEFRRRIKSESGLTPFVLDAASLGVPVGRAATLLARSGASGRAVAALARVADRHGRLRPLSDFAETAHRAARAPRDARRLATLRSELEMATFEGDVERQAVVRNRIRNAEANARTTERPALRYSGGEGGVRKQTSSSNLIIGLGQRGLDRARRRAHKRAVDRSGHELGPGGRLITVRGRRTERMTALRPGEREVVPKTTGLVGRSGRELPGLRRYTGRVARDLGEQQSVSRIKLLTHRGRVLHAVDSAIKRLDPDEQTSLKYMLQLGATPDAAGVRILERRRDQITAARAANRTRIPSVLRDTNDELALIDRILADPERHLTPRARAVADELRDLQIAEARRDPELRPEQELIRRLTPQGAALGVTRAPDAEFFRGVLREIESDTGVTGLAAHVDELASMHPQDRGTRANELWKDMRKQARKAEKRVGTAERRLTAANARIRELERRNVPLTTAEMTEARKELARAKRARRAAGRRVTELERRSGELAGRLGERERGGRPLPTAEVQAARGTVSKIQKVVNSLQRRVATAERRAGHAAGRADARTTAQLGRKIASLRKRRDRVNAKPLPEEPIAALTESLQRIDLDAQIRELELQRGNVADLRDAMAPEKVAAELQDNLKLAQDVLRDARKRLKEVERAAPRLTPTQMLSGLGAEADRATRAGALTDAELRVAGAKARLEGAEAAAPRVPDWLHDRAIMRERELGAARATRDHVRNFQKALKRVERASKHKFNMRLEDAESFADRVLRAARDEGLAAPAYWWSSVRPEDMASLAAAGRGLRAAHANKAYKGKLFDIGAEEHGVDVFTRGIERNIKRRFQQALVVRNLETHAYEWSRGIHGGGLTLKEIKRHMDDRAIDPRSIELVDPRVIRRANAGEWTPEGRMLAREPEGNERGIQIEHDDFNPDEDFITTTQQDLAEARRRWEEVARDELKHQSQHRFLVVPREVGETLDGVAARMDNTFWRAMEIVLKQKPARILLGAANVPWLAFQIASNAILTGFGGGVNPFNIHGAHKWWKGLTPDEREAVEAEFGITHGHHFGMDQPHLGATNSRMVNFWRAYKKSRVGRIGHTINPLNVMFRLDEAQNNFFRKVLFYDRARKSAYRRMGHSWQSIDRLMTRAVDRVLARPPHQQAHLLARHGAEFEQIAKHVNDFLGEYTRFTPAERFLLQRNIMFYGYLRFSLRFVFYTMPIAHPIMANILGNVGRMGADEIKKLMGVGDGYQLPTSILTQTYFGDRKDAQKNELRSLPLGRFNPFMNALTQLDGMQQAFGVVSPFYQLLADQAFEESSFTGRDWRIGGRPTPSESDRPRNYFGSAMDLLNPLAYDVPGHQGKPRNRIFESGVLNLAYPYRVATQTGIPGVIDPLEPNQSDDALLWRPQPMTYADPDAAKGVKKSRVDYANEGVGKHLASALLPVFPKRTSAPAVVARELEREDAIRERNKRKPGQRKKRRSKHRKVRRSYSTGRSRGPYG